MNPYRPILDALLALDDKRLARGRLYDEDLKCGCAMGAFIPAPLREATGEDYSVAVVERDGVADFITDEFEDYCTPLGVTAAAAFKTQCLNDSTLFADQTPEARYLRVVTAITEWAKEEP